MVLPIYDNSLSRLKVFDVKGNEINNNNCVNFFNQACNSKGLHVNLLTI